jgi:hypothetical protein
LFWVTPLAGFEVTTYGRFSGDHRGLTPKLMTVAVMFQDV